MSRNLYMPSKKEITLHWQQNYDIKFEDDFCWGCGYPTNSLHRAHLLAHCNGGDENPNNLILLCRFCHYEIQEHHTNTQEQADKIKSLIINGMPFFTIKANIYIGKLKLGIYDDFMIKKGFTKKQINEVKNLKSILV